MYTLKRGKHYSKLRNGDLSAPSAYVAFYRNRSTVRSKKQELNQASTRLNCIHISSRQLREYGMLNITCKHNPGVRFSVPILFLNKKRFSILQQHMTKPLPKLSCAGIIN